MKAFGFDAVEMDAARLYDHAEELLAAAKGAGLRVNCINTFFDFGKDDAADEAAMDRALALCGPAGCKNLLAIPGFLAPEEMDRSSAAFAARREQLAKALRVLCKKAAALGVTILMEDFDADVAPYYNGEELLWFMENVEGLKCGFDTGNFAYAEEDAAKLLPKFLPHIGMVHCKDRGFTENDGDVKLTVNGNKLYPVAVGDGGLPIGSMVKTILASGYKGTFAGEHYGSKHQLADMERTAKFLKTLVTE